MAEGATEEDTGPLEGESWTSALHRIMRENIVARVSQVNCAVHGKTASVRWVSPGADSTAYIVDGCCDAVKERARAVCSFKS